MIRSESLKQWDGTVAPNLSAIRGRCEWLAYYSRDLVSLVAHLPVRPAWETQARDDLDTAERELTIALAKVKEAQRQYDNLPRMMDAPALEAAE
jgi:hypothetical protein